MDQEDGVSECQGPHEGHPTHFLGSVIGREPQLAPEKAFLFTVVKQIAVSNRNSVTTRSYIPKNLASNIPRDVI